MPEVKKDRRALLFSAVVLGISALAGVPAWFLYGTPGMLCVVGVVTALFLGMVVWLVAFYRCPVCGERLKPRPDQNSEPLRHFCPKCDVIWDSGVQAGGSGD